MTAQDLIKAALQHINSYQSGDQLASMDANDCLVILNDLLDSWSTDHDAVFGSNENILYFTGGKYQYTIGIDPTGATTADFVVARPLRITNAFTRITTTGSGYDYPIEIIAQDRYVEYGLKPFPTHGPRSFGTTTRTFGTINFYGAPVGGGELHLFTDTILANLTLNQTIVMPQGYSRAIKWNLARELCLSFGMPLSPALEKMAMESYKAIKSLNASPTPESKLDGELMGNRTDAGLDFARGL